MIEGIRAFEEAFGLGIGVVLSVVPLVLLLWLFSKFIKRVWIRVPFAILIWGTALSESRSLEYWNSRPRYFIWRLERIYPALIAYRNDHGNAFPERLSQLFPGYLPHVWRYSLFHSQPGLQPTRSDEDVDRRSVIEYVGGKGSGILAANREAIEDRGWVTRWFHKPVRVVLKTDGKIETLPEKEYQRRLAAEP